MSRSSLAVTPALTPRRMVGRRRPVPLNIGAVRLALTPLAVGDGIYSAWGFAAFTALLIALSAASFRFYEVPARRHIERRFQRGEAAPPPVGEPATASVVPTRRSAPPF